MSTTLEYEDRLEDDILPVDEGEKDLPTIKEDVQDGSPLRPEERKSYNDRAEEAGIALSSDFDYVVEQMTTLTDEEAVNILLDVIDVHRGEPMHPMHPILISLHRYGSMSPGKPAKSGPAI